MINNFVCELDHCTGCMACYNSCKHGAMVVRREGGFYYPEINIEKCVDCGLCKKSCPVLSDVEKNRPRHEIAYAVLSKEKVIRDSSSSGGVFYHLANATLNRGGSVYGAAYTESLSVRHTRITRIKDIRRLQGSKYVQSCVDDTYKQVEEDLKQGKYVLFSGVSCQIAGLKKFLRKKYERLLLVEVLCHGGASPVAYGEHLKYVGQQHRSEVTEVNFRYKTKDKCQNLLYRLANGKELLVRQPLDDFFYRGFQGGVLLRNSCFECKYVGLERCADITLADFWGVNKKEVTLPDEMSYTSLVFVNTEKGETVFKELYNELIVVERPLQEAVNGNISLRRHIPRTKWNGRFFKELEENGYKKAAQHCLIQHFNLKDIIKKAIGYNATRILLRILRR